MDFADKILHLHLRELREQGHSNTGKLERDSRVERYGDIGDSFAVVRILMPDYAAALDTGVRKGKVPYANRRGKGSGSDFSNYIQGLFEWLSERYPAQSKKELLNSSFKIAKTASRTGHPTPGSYRYSQNGRRSGFTKLAAFDAERDMDLFVEQTVSRFVNKRTAPKYELKLLINFG